MTLRSIERRFISLQVLAWACIHVFFPYGETNAQRQVEKLNRGVIAVPRGSDSALVSWRMLATDPKEIRFHCYRQTDDGNAVRLSKDPISNSTCFIDRSVDFSKSNSYFVRPVIGGEETSSSRRFEISATDKPNPYFAIPLQTPKGYLPNDASVGDLDGDGEYEIVLHQVGRGRDNSQGGFTSEPILEAYKLDGTMLWRINLGKNIREGAHYTQFMVFDLDGDGRAEVACKTADGTIDGEGKVIGNDHADFRNERGYILDGPEFLTIFDGLTGVCLATQPYDPPRGEARKWGDDYGNRVDRFLACVAYLDGKRPSLVMCRGYYTRSVLVGWNWRDKKLSKVWTFDSDSGPDSNKGFRGQGNHGIAVGDIDSDGRDEIIYGSCVIDDDGTGLYSTGLGHGDAMHFSDHDPNRSGLEVFKANGDKSSPAGIQMRDARTGEQIWGVPSTGSKGVVRACAADIDPRYDGSEAWGKGRGVDGLYDVRGNKISARSPRTCNMAIWWDGDLLRELLDGVRITKWNYEGEREALLFDGRKFNCVSNNGSKSNPCLCADILGDWREELIVRSRDGKELRIFSTSVETNYRFVTLMHDPVYRLSVAWQNVSYNQPAHTGFYLGERVKLKPTRTP